jgi:diacylglycerol kinase (ATP)
MMQATLIYNPNARSTTTTPPEELQEALLKAGYQPVCRTTASEEELDEVLAGIEGLVIAAGGDGSLRAVVTRLIGKKDVSLSVLPLGTANNTARTLGITGTPLEIIAGLAEPRRQFLDIGYMRGPWGEDYFLEGAGWGLFADALTDYAPEQGKSVTRGLGTIIKTLTGYKVYDCQMALDGQDISGSYILVEALNTTAIGPRLQLAPEANPGDGLLDVVRVRDHPEEGMLDYIASLLTGELNDLSSVEMTRGQKLEVMWTGFYCHADAEIRPPLEVPPEGQAPVEEARPVFQSERPATLTIEVLPKALEFWLPAPPASQSD